MTTYLELILDYALVFRGASEFLCGGFPSPLDTASAVYFSGITIMTIGYGDIQRDIQPTHWFPRLMSVYEALNGIALIVVSFTVYVSRSIDKKEFYGEQLGGWRKKLTDQVVDQDVAWRVEMAVEELLKRDQDLFRLGTNERAITHRFGIYLERYFTGWNVDCEYNRTGQHPKRVTTDNGLQLVLPDVIVHRRGTTENLLAIEVKISPTSDGVTSDKQKLLAYKRDLRYIHAIFIGFILSTEGRINVEPEWVVD